MTTLKKIRDTFYKGKTYFIRHKGVIYECRAKKYTEKKDCEGQFIVCTHTLTVEIPSLDGKEELELMACDFFNPIEKRVEKIVLFDNISAAIYNNENESLSFPMRCDADIAKSLGFKFIEGEVIGYEKNPLRVSAYIWDGYAPHELYPGRLSIESIDGPIMRVVADFGNKQKVYATYHFSDPFSGEWVERDGWYATEEETMKKNKVKIIRFDDNL